MIKLIATDVDGTLVNDDKKLPDNFNEVIDLLQQKGINFAISSGRSYSALYNQFKDYSEKISFICDNGSYIVDKGEIISRSIIPQKAIYEIIDFCEKHDLIPLICGQNGTYFNCNGIEYTSEVAKYYNNTVYIDDLKKIDDSIFKIAIFGENGIEEKGFPMLKRVFGDYLSVSLSGFHWADIMNPGINKGRGINILQNKIGASYEETMAFGDYLNDIEMLENAYYSYAMSNAHPNVKKIANFSTGSNNDGCVTAEILRILK